MGNFFPKAEDKVIKCLVLSSHQRYLVTLIEEIGTRQYSHPEQRICTVFS